MLDHAFIHKEKLQEIYAKALTDEYFKYYIFGSYIDYVLNIKENDWNTIQKVSINNDRNIIGYMSSDIERDTKIIRQLRIINFTKQTNITFSKDLLSFIKYLKYNINASKFEFIAVQGSKAESIYNKFIKKYGGRIIGISNNSIMLTDGKLYNTVHYEIMREDMKF